MGIKNSTNTLDKVVKNQNSFLVFGALVSIFSICLFCYICSNIRLINIDDVMYANWTKHGIKYFCEQVWWHINNFNGRTLIHVLLSLTLVFKQYLYSILLPLSIYFSTFFLHSLFEPNSLLQRKMISSSIVVILFLSLHELFLSTTVLWMASGFNYIIPLFFVSLAYFLFYFYRNNSKYMILSLTCSFIAGATTEQYGMYIVGLLILTLFFDIIEKQKHFIKFDIISILCSVCGLLTILLSAGTSVRAERELGGIGYFLTNFINNNSFLFGYSNFYFMWMVVIFGFSIIGLNKKYRFMLFGIPFGLIITLFYFSAYSSLIGPIFLIYVCLLCVWFLKNKSFRMIGKIIVCGYGTFFMMSLVTVNGFRVCVPFLLTIIIALVLCYIKLCFQCNTIKKTYFIPFVSVFLICLINVFGFCSNVTQNKTMHAEPMYNAFNDIDRNDEIVLNFDNNLLQCSWSNYRYATAIDTGLITDMQFIYDYYDFDQSVPIHHISKGFDVADITIDGKYYILPIIQNNGTAFVPHTVLSYLDGYRRMQFGGLMQIAPDGSVCDGFITDDNKSLAFSNVCSLARIENKTIVYQKDNAPYQTFTTKAFTIYFINIEDFCEWAELSYEYDSNKNTYHFKTNNRQEN